jgi:C1A family cysteine protease
VIDLRFWRPSRGTGYKRDRHDDRDAKHAFDRRALSSFVPPAVSLRRFVISVLNQGRTSSCVAHAWEQGIRTATFYANPRMDPSTIPLGSRLFGYFNARAQDHDQKVDAGTYLRSYAAGRIQVGCPVEAVWPFNPLKVNSNPPPRAYHAAFDYRGLRGYHRITELGEARLLAIRAAIAAGLPVVFGTLIDTAFAELTGPEARIPNPARSRGRHAMCIVGYRAGWFLIVNSWGTEWGDGGFAWLPEAMIASAESTDFWVVSV